MPTYEYKCTADNSKFEIWQEVGAEAPPCPDCGAPSKKVFSPTRTIFKGSGFYVTDLRAEQSAKTASKTPAQSESKPETTEKSSETPTTETPKTETKTETPKNAAS